MKRKRGNAIFETKKIQKELLEKTLGRGQGCKKGERGWELLLGLWEIILGFTLKTFFYSKEIKARKKRLKILKGRDNPFGKGCRMGSISWQD